MSEFANYTPGEYAKEHIRITPTTLADGRAFFYLDDDPEYVSGAKTRELNVSWHTVSPTSSTRPVRKCRTLLRKCVAIH